MNQRPNHVPARRAPRRAALSATSALAAGMGAALLAAAPAHAADECGPAVAGAVTCTAAGNPYAGGITYTPTGAFSLTTNPDVAATNTVTVTSADDVQANNNGSIATTANGAYGLNISGANVGINNAGTISTAGTADRDPESNLPTTPYPNAVLVNATGTVDFTNTGSITTAGDGTAAVNITAGGGVTINSTGPVTTSGNGTESSANGIQVTSGGGVSATVANVTTSGADTTAVMLTAAGPVTVNANMISGGNGAVAVTTSAGDIAFNGTDLVTTNGQFGVINLDAAAGGVTVNADRITGGGDALLAHGGTGPVAVTLGDVTASGGITATSDADAASIVLTKAAKFGSVNATGGTSASLLVSTGATLNSGNVNLTGGSTATFENRGTTGVLDPNNQVFTLVSATAPTTSFVNSGIFAGSFSLLGDTSNSVSNSGQFTFASGLYGRSTFSTSGINSFTNTGTILSPISQRTTDQQEKYFAPAQISIRGTFTFQNNGTIDLRNGAAGDALLIGNAAAPQTTGSPAIDAGTGSFVGGAGSTLYLEAYQSGTVSLTDKIVATGPITGSTIVYFSQTSSAPALTGGLVFAQGGAGSSATAFTAAALPSGGGLVRYGLSFDPNTNSYALVGTPSDTLARTLKINEGAQQLFYRSADTVSSHFAEIRDARYGGYATGGGRLWGTIYGQNSNRRDGQNISPFGFTNYADTAYQQNTFGGQIGFDAVGQAGSDGFTVGVMGGFQSSTINFSHSDDRTRFRVANAGVLLGFQKDGAFVNALGQFSYYWARARSTEAAFSDRFTGNSYGGQIEGGYRFGVDRFYVEPVATIAYSRTNLNNLQASQDISVDFGVFQGLRGKAGARVGSRFDLGDGAVAVAYAQGNYVHEFKGEDGVSIIDVDTAVTLGNRRIADYGEGKIGFSAGSAGGVTGFVEGFGTVGRDYRGGGGRAGVRVKL